MDLTGICEAGTAERQSDTLEKARGQNECQNK